MWMWNQWEAVKRMTCQKKIQFFYWIFHLKIDWKKGKNLTETEISFLKMKISHTSKIMLSTKIYDGNGEEQWMIHDWTNIKIDLHLVPIIFHFTEKENTMWTLRNNVSFPHLNRYFSAVTMRRYKNNAWKQYVSLLLPTKMWQRPWMWMIFKWLNVDILHSRVVNLLCLRRYLWPTYGKPLRFFLVTFIFHLKSASN